MSVERVDHPLGADPQLAMQAEQTSLETRNEDLARAFKDKCKAQQQVQKLYQSLKAQVMASHVANAAGDEAELALHTARGDRFIDRLPGTRTGSASFAQMGMSQQPGGGRLHNRADSRSSGSGGQQQSGVALGPNYSSHLQGRGLAGRMGTGRKFALHSILAQDCFKNVKLTCLESAPVGTPSQAHRSRLPVLGGTRQNAFLNAESGPPYQASPITRQPMGGGVARNAGSFALGGAGRTSRKSGGAGNYGSLGR